jgi:hypothetical protein
MAGMGTVSVPINKALGETTITIEVTGKRRALLRLFVSGLLFRLGAWVSPCDVRIADPEQAERKVNTNEKF